MAIGSEEKPEKQWQASEEEISDSKVITGAKKIGSLFGKFKQGIITARVAMQEAKSAFQLPPVKTGGLQREDII